MNRQGKARFWLSKRLLSSHLGKRRLYSASDNRFQIYPRLFPFAMLNIMQHGKKFLKINDPTCDGSLNSVLIESNGMIDPYLPFSGVGSSFPQRGSFITDKIGKPLNIDSRQRRLSYKLEQRRIVLAARCTSRARRGWTSARR